MGLVLAFFMSLKVANAASTCDYSEQVNLSSAASVVQANYEIVTDIVYVSTGLPAPDDVTEEDVSFDSDYALSQKINVFLLNLSDDVYVEVKNNLGFNETYTYANTDSGKIMFFSGDLSDILTFTFTIYSNSSNCKGESLRTLSLTTPKYNTFSDYNACDLIPDFSYCQEFITTPFYATEQEISGYIFDEFYKKQEELKQEKQETESKKSFFDKVKDFLNQYRYWFIGIFVIIVFVGVATTVIILKKRRSRII